MPVGKRTRAGKKKEENLDNVLQTIGRIRANYSYSLAKVVKTLVTKYKAPRVEAGASTDHVDPILPSTPSQDVSEIVPTTPSEASVESSHAPISQSEPTPSLAEASIGNLHATPSPECSTPSQDEAILTPTVSPNFHVTPSHYPEFDTFKDLIISTTYKEKVAVQWARENDFLAPESHPCGDCVVNNRNGIMKYYQKKKWTTQRAKGNIYYQCSGEGKRCQKRVSPFKGTFFDGLHSKIPVSKALELIYMFSEKIPVLKAAKECKVNKNTAVDYYNYLREVCAHSTAAREDYIIGGEGLTVEIDESKFFCRKYNKGRLQGSQKDGWVFGGVCRETGEIFMVRVADRSRKTLYEIIKKHIREGSTVISDEWKAYQTLQEELGYTHKTICHKRNFVCPEDNTVHTQNIENRWRYAKMTYPRNGTTKDMRDSYLQEYLYRVKHSNENIQDRLLEDIKQMYKWHA